MADTEKNQLALNMVLKSIWRKKWLILICIFGVTIPIVVFNQKARPVYEAKAAIIYEHYRDAMDAYTRFRPLDKTILNNEVEEIKSYSLAEDVAKSLPQDVIKSYAIPEKKSADFDRNAFFSKLVRKNILASNIVGSDVIVIKTRAETPKNAMVLAQTVIEVLKRRNLETRRQSISSVRKLIEDQLNVYETKLKIAEENLKNYKEKGAITYIAQESIEILKRITEAEVLYNKALANRDASEKRLKYLQQKLAKDRENLLSLITETTSPMVRRLKNELLELEVQYVKLKVQHYAENHPKLIELESQINQTKLKLIAETVKIKQGENIIDPLSQIQQFMREIVNLDIEVQTDRAQEKALRQIIRNYKDELKSVPEKELKIARLLRDQEVNNKIYTMLMEKREEARIHEAEKFGNVRVLDNPKMPEKSVWPKKALNLILGCFLGLIIGFGFITFSEILDNRLKTTEQIRNESDLSVVGTIPKLNNGENAPTKSSKTWLNRNNNNSAVNKLTVYHNPNSIEIEVFRTLRTNLQFLGLGNTHKSILVTSCCADEGKSLITANLGIALVQMGLKTLIIDADLRKPSLHKLFGIDREPGLTNLIMAEEVPDQNRMSASSAVQENNEIQHQQDKGDVLNNSEVITDYTSNVIQHEAATGLDFISSGIILANTPDILALPKLQTVIESLKKQYDVILFDSPPTNVIVDASLLSSAVDSVLLVVKTGVNSKLSISKVKEIFERTKTKILGIVVNFAEKEFYYTSYYSKNGHV